MSIKKEDMCEGCSTTGFANCSLCRFIDKVLEKDYKEIKRLREFDTEMSEDEICERVRKIYNIVKKY